jgi:DNA repair exonuclease SbcCD nuclease subunit
MPPVRFVHAADLHLDAPFAGVDASDPRVRSALVASTFEAFERVVALCLDEKADFLIIAGDVYDNARNFNAQLRFQQQTARLAEAGIAVFVVEGNHDPESTRPRDLRLPENVHYFSTRSVERVPLERDGQVVCVLYGRGFARAAETRNLAKDFTRAAGDTVAIGVLHTNVGGREGFEDYAPASMDDLRAARMDYWALGHIHKPEVLSESPAIVYAGCPQGRSPKEDGLRGCYVVEIEGGHAEVSFRPTCSVVWERRTLDISALEDIDGLRASLRGLCDDVRSSAGGLPAIVRIELVGRAPVHAALTRGTVLADIERDLRDEQLAGQPWLWVDRVRDRTSAAFDIGELRSAPGFEGDLVRFADELGADEHELEATIADLLRPIESSLGAVDLGLTARELLERARDTCLDRLEGDAR